MRFKMFRKAIIGITLSAMLGGSFAASLPRVNVVANAQAQAQSIKPTENTITYNYNGDTPLKLTGYSNSVVAYNEGVSNLQYNAQNEIIRDDHGNALDYDALGAMIAFENSQTHEQVNYRYDAESHQESESVIDATGKTIASQAFYYSTGDKAQMLAESDSDGNELSYLFAETKIGSINNSDEANLYITDQAGSVVALASNSQLSYEYIYSPYGIETDLDQSAIKAKNAQGFDEQRTDKATGYQFLGNGYRAYNPILHRFMQMDDIRDSPFDKGGINGYVFANNNPIMSFDPSGHDAAALLKIFFGLAETAAAAVVGIFTANYFFANDLAIIGGTTFFDGLFAQISGKSQSIGSAFGDIGLTALSTTIGFGVEIFGSGAIKAGVEAIGVTNSKISSLIGFFAAESVAAPLYSNSLYTNPKDFDFLGSELKYLSGVYAIEGIWKPGTMALWERLNGRLNIGKDALEGVVGNGSLYERSVNQLQSFSSDKSFNNIWYYNSVKITNSRLPYTLKSIYYGMGGVDPNKAPGLTIGLEVNMALTTIWIGLL